MIICDFCQKSDQQVEHLIIANGGKVAICGECADVCTDILASERAKTPADQSDHEDQEEVGPS